ncbi:hypothetical protein DD237_005197 [Peronospora effusa]|uniref:Kazal-like domain-containing protein n=1 Tax=Peronospora effusa TaxID=542832 RepID=A0A425C0E9_9STRA|nr:hypothetical protein DD237_005197 [Peronospora effusa]
MKTNGIMMVAAWLVVVCSVHGDDSTPEEKKLRVVSQVHANPAVFVSVEENRSKRNGHCVDTGAINQDPVCASNGKQYMNEDVFEFHKCLVQAKYGEMIEIVDMDVCKNAQKEDYANVYYVSVVSFKALNTRNRRSKPARPRTGLK